MWKKMMLAGFGLICAVGLMAPPKANAEVVIGVRTRPYVYVAPPYVAYRPRYVYSPYFYRTHVFIGGRLYARPYARAYVGPRYGWRR